MAKGAGHQAGFRLTSQACQLEFQSPGVGDVIPVHPGNQRSTTGGKTGIEGRNQSTPNGIDDPDAPVDIGSGRQYLRRSIGRSVVHGYQFPVVKCLASKGREGVGKMICFITDGKQD